MKRFARISHLLIQRPTLETGRQTRKAGPENVARKAGGCIVPGDEREPDQAKVQRLQKVELPL